MADGDGKCVRRVVGARNGFELQKPLDHIHHLPLLGEAVADDRLLDLHGRVFEKRHSALGRRAEDDAAPVRDGDAGGDVVGEEQLLDRDRIGLELRDQLLHVALDLHETRGQRKPRLRGNRTVAKHLRPAGLRLDQAEADNGDTGVNAEYSHDHPPFRIPPQNIMLSLYQTSVQKASPSAHRQKKPPQDNACGGFKTAFLFCHSLVEHLLALADDNTLAGKTLLRDHLVNAADLLLVHDDAALLDKTARLAAAGAQSGGDKQ